MSNPVDANKKLLEIYKAELAPPANWELKDAKAYREALRGAKTTKTQIARFAPIGAMRFEAELEKLVKASAGEKQELFRKQLDVLPPDSFPFIRFTNESPDPDDEELLRRGRLIRNAMNKYDPYSSDHFEPMVQATSGQLVSVDSIRYKANLVDAPPVNDPVIEYIKTLPKSPGPKMKILSSAKDFQASDYDADTLFFWTDGRILVEKDSSGNTKPFKENLLNENLLKIHLAIKRHGGDFLLKLKEENEYRIIGIQNEIDRQLREFMIFGTTGNYVNRYTFMEALQSLNTGNANSLMYDYVIDDATYKIFAKTLEIDSKGYRKWKRYVNDKMARYLRFMTVHHKGELTTEKTDSNGNAIVKMKAYKDLNKQAEAKRDRIVAIRQIRSNRAAAPTPSAPPAPLSLEDMRDKIIDNISNNAIASKANPLCGALQNLSNYKKRMERWGFDISVIDDRQKLAELLALFKVADLILLYKTIAFCAYDQKKIIEKLGRNFTTSEDTDEKRATFTWNFAKGIAPAPLPSAPPAPIKLVNKVMKNIRDGVTLSAETNKEGYDKRMKELGFDPVREKDDFKEFTPANLKDLFDKLTEDDHIFLLKEISKITRRSTITAYLESKGGNSQVKRIEMLQELIKGDQTFITSVRKRSNNYKKFRDVKCVRIIVSAFEYPTRMGVISDKDYSKGKAKIQLYQQVTDSGPINKFEVDLENLEPLNQGDCDREKQFNELSFKAAAAKQVLNNSPFGILEGQDALDLIDEKKLTFSTPTAATTKKDWFDVSLNVSEHYHAKLFYAAENGVVKRLVIACIEASDDIDGVGTGDKKTMELIEIQNYAKVAGGSAESIRPFVKKVLEETEYNAVETVYLSPANPSLTKIYKDLWGMEEVSATGGSTWLKANKDDLIYTLGKTTQEVKDDKKALEAAKSAQTAINNAVELDTIKVSTKKWIRAWVKGDPTRTPKFYIARQGDQNNLGRIFDKLGEINSPYVAKYKKLKVQNVKPEKKSLYLFEYGDQTYKFLSDKNFADKLYLTEAYGTPLKLKRVTDDSEKPSNQKLREQMVEALGAIHKAGIQHQDVTLDNMMWDNEKQIVTLIDFSDARLKENQCEVNLSGKTINILPPVGLQVDKDKWSLVLALLNYGGKTMYRPEDDMTKQKPFENALTRILFEVNSNERKDTPKLPCWVLKAKTQPGFMFHDDGKGNIDYRKSRLKQIEPDLFYHLWFIFNRAKYPTDTEATFGWEIPGPKEQNKQLDGVDYAEILAKRMDNTNIDLAKRWVEGHLRWNELQTKIGGETRNMVNQNKVRKKEAGVKSFKTVTIPKDLGDEYYGIKTEEVVKIFEIIKGVAAATPSPSGSSFNDLAYDSFSDAELDELEVTYEPYDEEELDRLMSEYDSSSGTDANMSYNSYNSESEQSVESDSYDSDSD